MTNIQLIVFLGMNVALIAAIIGGQSFYLSRYLDEKFAAMDARLDAFSAEIATDTRFDAVDNARFDTVNARFVVLNKRLSMVETEIRAIKP